MAKLYFRYGVVSSAKTLNLLATVHNYEQQGKVPILIKPAMDTRSELVESRAGLSHKADIILSQGDDVAARISPFRENLISAIIVDEVQFLTKEQIESLRMISTFLDIPVLCYGLRTKSDATLWPCIITLMAVADSIEEIKTTCTFCDNKAIFSKAVVATNDQGINLGWDTFIPVCSRHFYGNE